MVHGFLLHFSCNSIIGQLVFSNVDLFSVALPTETCGELKMPGVRWCIGSMVGPLKMKR